MITYFWLIFSFGQRLNLFLFCFFNLKLLTSRLLVERKTREREKVDFGGFLWPTAVDSFRHVVGQDLLSVW